MAAASPRSSSRLLAAAVLAALVAGAWCAPIVTFTVGKGSGKEKLNLVIVFEKAGDSLAEVELRDKDSSDWLPLKESEGGVWKIESNGKLLEGPFNIRFLSKNGLRNVFDNVIPAEYKVGTTYSPEA